MDMYYIYRLRRTLNVSVSLSLMRKRLGLFRGLQKEEEQMDRRRVNTE